MHTLRPWRWGPRVTQGSCEDSSGVRWVREKRWEGRTKIFQDGLQRRPADSPKLCSEFLSQSTSKCLTFQLPRRLWGPRLETEVGLGGPGGQPGCGEGLAPPLRHRSWPTSLLWEGGRNECCLNKDGIFFFSKEESPRPQPLKRSSSHLGGRPSYPPTQADRAAAWQNEVGTSSYTCTEPALERGLS